MVEVRPTTMPLDAFGGGGRRVWAHFLEGREAVVGFSEFSGRSTAYQGLQQPVRRSLRGLQALTATKEVSRQGSSGSVSFWLVASHTLRAHTR